ncbi:uncharacterized protein BN796_00844 [Alistipes sp. CAG:831]|mgnify:CR=1 FL=1|nr:uncharacterized protein BN796_00844 [Alistipes sp. CAG:831]
MNFRTSGQLLLTAMIVLLTPATLPAQPDTEGIHERSSFSISNDYSNMKISKFSVIYLSEDHMLYNLMNRAVYDSPVYDFNINPTGASIAVVNKNAKNIVIVSNREKNVILATIKGDKKTDPFDEKGRNGTPSVTAMTYSSDAREILAANDFGEIITYSTDGYWTASVIEAGKIYDHIAVSPNGYYIAAAHGSEMDIWDVDAADIKRIVRFAGKVNHVTFSPDSREIAVSCDTSGLQIVNAIDHHRTEVTKGIQNVRQASFHPDGKYIAYAKADSIIVYNLINHRRAFSAGSIRIKGEPLDIPMSDIMALNFHSNNSTTTLSHNTGDKVVFWDMSSLPPLYRSKLSEEVDKLMSDWIRQMDGESLEEYRVRVTDDNAARQKAMLLDQAATAIATQVIALEDPFISEEYDMENHTIDIKFEQLDAIKLEVPEEEFQEVREGDLSYENPIYTLDDMDEFQLVYLEVVNRTTDKTYIFDERDYIIEDIEFEDDDIDFIPVAMLQTVNMEMEMLQQQTQEIMEEKKQENVITDKTAITIDTEIESDFDSDGNKIYNYNLGYQYDVSEGFSYQEDFGPGKFIVTESNAAMTMLEAIRTALAGDMKKYVDQAKSIEITITGSADAIPVGRILYDGSCGEYVETPYYAKDELSSMTVTDETDIRNNEQLAFIRAASVKVWLENNVEELRANSAKCVYNYRTEVSDVRGGEFRRIIVNIKFRDAIK